MSAYSDAILATTGLQAYYRMDETSGSIAHDATSHHYDATLSGSFTLSQAGAISGDTDTAILFDGTTGMMSLPTALNDTTFTALSIEWWIKVTSSWLYVVVTTDGSTTTVYVNAESVTTAAGANVEVGALFDSIGSASMSTLDEIAIYNVALTLSQIQSHYATGTQVSVSQIQSSITAPALGYQPWYVGMTYPALYIPLNVDSPSGQITDTITSIPVGNFAMTIRSSGGIDTTGTGTFVIVTTNPAVITYQFSSGDVATTGTYQLFIKATVPGSGLVIWDPIPFVISAS